MIAFWKSESESREVFYQSITGEDTGEIILGIPILGYEYLRSQTGSNLNRSKILRNVWKTRG